MATAVVWMVATLGSDLAGRFPVAFSAPAVAVQDAPPAPSSNARPTGGQPDAPRPADRHEEPSESPVAGRAEGPRSGPEVTEGLQGASATSGEDSGEARKRAPPEDAPQPGASAPADTLPTAHQGNQEASPPLPPSETPEPSTSPDLPPAESRPDDGGGALSGSDRADWQVGPGRSAGGEVQAVWLNDLRTNILFGVVLVSLAIASLVGKYLSRQPSESVNPALVRRFRQRVNAWWLMCAILVFGMLLQPIGTVVLFGLISFWALREFITMAPTRRGDHRALFWALVVFTPLQYVLIGLERSGWQWRNGREIDFYGLYSIMIPVYASLFVPARIALAGDHKRFLERSAQITVGLLICVYALSYAPALINLELVTSSGRLWRGSPAGLLFFLILMAQLSDILQWIWGHLVGKHIIAPEISASRSWEGFAGGTLSTGLIGAALFWVTPFAFWEAACMSMVIAVMGMFGGMTMSAIKRDRGVNDYGTLVIGHAGVLDRIDTLCFAAPVFYHLTRFFFSA